MYARSNAAPESFDSRSRSALSFGSRSGGSVMFLFLASDCSSSLALLWSSTMRLPKFLTSVLAALSCASLPSSTSAMPPFAASMTNVWSDIGLAVFFAFFPDAKAGAAAIADARVPTRITFFIAADLLWFESGRKRGKLGARTAPASEEPNPAEDGEQEGEERHGEAAECDEQMVAARPGQRVH